MSFKVFDTSKTKVTSSGRVVPKRINLRENGLLYLSKAVLTDMKVIPEHKFVVPMVDDETQQIGLLFSTDDRTAAITLTHYEGTAQAYVKKMVAAYKIPVPSEWDYQRAEVPEMFGNAPQLFYVLTQVKDESQDEDVFTSLGVPTNGGDTNEAEPTKSLPIEEAV